MKKIKTGAQILADLIQDTEERIKGDRFAEKCWYKIVKPIVDKKKKISNVRR